MSVHQTQPHGQPGDGHGDGDARAPFLLGMDPGVCTGLAGYDPAARQLVFVTSAAPLAALRHLTDWHASGRLLAVWIEDARDLPLYARYRHLPRGARDRAARSVGQVDSLTALYVDACRALDVPVSTVGPDPAGKWTADTLRRLCRWGERSNQHGRDAARLVFGRAAPRRLIAPAVNRRGGDTAPLPAPVPELLTTT